MSERLEHPFKGPNYSGHQTYVMTANDRITRVKSFDRMQCLAALAMPNLQATVTKAVERRLRQLERGLA